jgi:hypothetical protein
MYTDSMEKLKAGVEHIRQAQKCFTSGPLDYWLKDLMECHDLLMRKYAPFKVGDIVVLTETPDIEEGSGWWCYRHFLVKGEKATVKEVSVDGTGFYAHIMFDNQTDSMNGKTYHITGDNRKVFRFHEDGVVRI